MKESANSKIHISSNNDEFKNSSLPPWNGVEFFFVQLRQRTCSSVCGCTLFSGKATGCVPHENGSRILYVIL
jgi:hypothetical protein